MDITKLTAEQLTQLLADEGYEDAEIATAEFTKLIEPRSPERSPSRLRCLLSGHDYA